MTFLSWKYSITLASFRDIEPLGSTLEKISKFRIDAVEMYGEPDVVDVKLLLDLVHSYNISISGITGMWGHPTINQSSSRKLITNDKRQLSQTLSYIMKCITLCEQVGGRTFNVCIFGDDSRLTLDKNHGRLPEAKKRRLVSSIIEPLGRLGAFAKDRGVELLIEPLNRYSTPVCNTAKDAIYLIESIGQKKVGLLLDTFHMNIEEDSIEETITKSGSVLGQLHISDNNRKMPGFGHINFSEIINALKQIQFDKYISFEPFIPDCNYENDISYGIDTITALSDRIG